MKSFLQGKKMLSVEPLRIPSAVSAVQTRKNDGAKHPHAPNAPGAATANVEVVKEGDKVVRLIVTCQCGERVEIECLYSAGR